MSKKLKTGRFTNEEIEYIRLNHEKVTPDKIAIYLNRDPASVKKFIAHKYVKGAKDDLEEFDIQKREYWSYIKDQFTPEERRIFVYHWNKIVAQFKDDVFATEEMQIVDVIKLEIMMNRIMLKQQTLNTDIARMEKELDTLSKLEFGDEGFDTEKALKLTSSITEARMAQQSIHIELDKILSKKNDILKSLKGTRDQRLKRIEQSKKSFSDWMQQIVGDRELRLKLGKEMEKHRIAADVEYARLSQPHKYINGEMDLPIFNTQTIKEQKDETE